MEIRIEERAQALVIRPVGRVDSVTASEFERVVVERLEAGAPAMIIDGSELVYISSAGLRVVLVAGKRLRASAGRLALCNLSKPIREVFEISGFASLFPVHDDLDAALRGLEGGGPTA